MGLRVNPDAEMVERLNEAEHLYDEVVQQTELHHLHTDAADLIESQSSRIAQLTQWWGNAESQVVSLGRELAAAREDAERYRWLRDNQSYSPAWCAPGLRESYERHSKIGQKIGHFLSFFTPTDSAQSATWNSQPVKQRNSSTPPYPLEAPHMPPLPLVSNERLAILCKIGSTDTQDLARELLAARSRIAELEAVVLRPLAAEGRLQEALERIAELEREVDEQCRLNGKGSEREVALLGKLESLQRNLAAAREDAARYKWLRQRMTHERAGPHYGWCVTEVIPGDDPDSAIDAARNAGKGEA